VKRILVLLAACLAAAPLTPFASATAQRRTRERAVERRDSDDDRDTQQRSSDREWSWEGSIPEGRWLYVRNLNGPIKVERGSGNRVEVTAVKRWRRGNPEDVRIEQKRGSERGDVVICALWVETSSCDEDGYRTRDHGWNDDNRNNDVEVDFTVRLPSDVKVAVSTVNGGLEISGATSEVDAHTVNGRVSASSSGGPVNAHTVNGDIDVSMGSMGRDDLTFTTVNGSVVVRVPGELNADVEMQTLNGSVQSDFPLMLSGRINPRRIHATIGRGGQHLQFHTVNGSVELRRS
jgi:Ni/Co efflux regulator RcnB